MKTQQIINATAKKHYIFYDDKETPVYLFIARSEKRLVTYIQDERAVEHIYNDLFHFYEFDIKRASKEFHRRLSKCDFDITTTKAELFYRNSDGFLLSTGIRVYL